MIRRDHNDYVESITVNLHHSQKPFWNWINKVKGCRTPIPSLVCNGNVVTSDSIKATLFNDYFVSVFTQEDVSNLEELQCQLPNSLFHLDAITVFPSEVSRELSSLKIGKACGPDQICPRLLREGADVLSLSLTELFNKSLTVGKLPQDWVSANITPVFKKGDKQQLVNY